MSETIVYNSDTLPSIGYWEIPVGEGQCTDCLNISSPSNRINRYLDADDDPYDLCERCADLLDENEVTP